MRELAFPYASFSEAWAIEDPDASGWIETSSLFAILQTLDEPWGTPPGTPHAAVLRILRHLNIPSHKGRHTFKEVLFCMVRRLCGVELPTGEIADTIKEAMKKALPTLQLDRTHSNPIVTAAEQYVISRVVTKLKERVLMSKLKRHKAGVPFEGPPQEQAAATILFFVRFMITKLDCIPSERLADERKCILSKGRVTTTP